MRRLTIILPGSAFAPIGGYKIMYEYAKRLAQKNYEIIFYYPERLMYLKRSFFRVSLKILLSIFRRPWSWYNFGDASKKIIHKTIPRLRSEHILDSDLIIVTSVETAYEVKILLEGKRISKPVIYFIQHFENWNVSDEKVKESYNFGFYNVVISKWLGERVKSSGSEVALFLPNAIDVNIFRIIVKPEDRDDKTVLMLYHTLSWKGSKEGIEALKILKEEIPDLKASLFGVFPRPKNLPDWINYIRNPKVNDLVNLYNQNAIFLSPSYSEGFSLPSAEAMACGCALVTANSLGVLEYAFNQKNAIVTSSPPNPYELAEAVKKLIDDREKRINFAYEGYRTIREFSWEKNTDEFDKFIKKIIG
ncbi:MAG: glycosyltransferase family 4 protein [Candidatus Kryptonium sp.]|nr:glycosyltransferase family 4 protein [Candidatus Kryptonium sp.]